MTLGATSFINATSRANSGGSRYSEKLISAWLLV
jgi:hypothetical protein